MAEEGIKETCEMCGLPLNDDNRCSCNPTKCVHCCTCKPDCTCGCKDKAAKIEE